MFDAQILINDATAGLTIYSPWMARGGDNAVFTLDMLQDQLSNAKTFVVTVFTKESEAAGDGGTATASVTYTAADGIDQYPFKATTGTLKDLVRFEYKFGATAVVGDQVMFRMTPPSWFDSVDA